MKSMTGYGLGKAEGPNYSITVETRSLNHRFLEISLRMPRQLNILEESLKKQVQAILSRGKVDIFLTLVRPNGKKVELLLDKELAIAYHNCLIQLSKISGLPLASRVEDIAAFPGVLNQEAAEDDIEEIGDLAATALQAALTQLINMRRREGQNLKEDIAARVNEIETIQASIKDMIPQLLEEQQQKLKKRLGELLEDISIDEARLANEIAFLTDRADINEELTRLASHCRQFEEAFLLPEAIGRRLDFLTQEMNREINTIGSKSTALAISNQVIEMKSALEKIREQVQNIE
ncbi:MAG: YicC family protein [Clostridiales bacterium]|nr:YicC family protein [Clostridiales bacterium]